MATLSIRPVRFDRLQGKGAADSAIVIKLMMACNDLSLANQALDDWKQTESRERLDRKIAAGMYFVRIELSHLHEALRVIHEIEHKVSLRALVDRCDLRTRDSYTELLKYIYGGSEYHRFQQLVGKLRHNLTFHYEQSDTLIATAIADRASRPDANLSSITRASSAHRWRFNVADDIVDSIVVRQLWKIPRTADLRVEADKIADEVYAVLRRFLDFSGEFIWRYCE